MASSFFTVTGIITAAPSDDRAGFVYVRAVVGPEVIYLYVSADAAETLVNGLRDAAAVAKRRA